VVECGGTVDDQEALARRLSGHLSSRYGASVAGIARLQPWNPFVHRVERRDGPAWVARVFPAERPLERAAGDAEILRLLEAHDYPAERCAHPDAVSALDGRAVLGTTHLAGAAPPVDAPVMKTIGGLLGRLATLPTPGAAGRPAGAWGGDPRHEGPPREDVLGAIELLAEVEDRVPPAHRGRFDSLRAQLETADDCHDLPTALIHPDPAPVNAVATPDRGLVLVDWTAAGRGPRIASLAWFLTGAGLPGGGFDPARVDAALAGYRAHVRLEDEELARLGAAMRLRALYFACWYFRRAVVRDEAPSGPGAEWCTDEANAVTDAIAARARAAFAR
jgi:Ser/Thr protein kinase RdoA (MazF antagonist)